MTIEAVEFPNRLAYNTSQGPQYSTNITTLDSGFEKRNQMWAGSLHRYDAGQAVGNQDDLNIVLAFFHSRVGRQKGFLITDYADYTSAANNTDDPSPTDQEIGTSDGATASFQLKKIYTYGSTSIDRQITRPKSGSVRVAVDGIEKTEGVDFSVNTNTGYITFLAGHIPSDGTTITAGFIFFVPVRFDVDYLETTFVTFTAFQNASIPIIEVRE